MDVNRLIILSRDARLAELRRLGAMDALKAEGHSATKAGEIHLDAVRGDRYALSWIKAVLDHEKA